MNSKERREVFLWLGVFAITAVFQFWRASELDGLIFIVIIALIAITAVSEREFTTSLTNPIVSRRAKLFLVSALCIIAISQIHTAPAMFAMLALIPLLLISREKHEHHHHPRKAVTRSAIAWSLVALAIALWELLSYVIGEVTGRDYRTPTISMLIDPFIQHNAGRIFFVVAWGFIGYELLFLRRVK